MAIFYLIFTLKALGLSFTSAMFTQGKLKHLPFSLFMNLMGISLLAYLGMILELGDLTFFFLDGGLLLGTVIFVLQSKVSMKDLVYPLCVLLGILLFIFPLLGHTQFSGWDEFSHWGVATRYLIKYKEIGFVTGFKSYPPLGQIFSAYMTSYSSFAESYAYTATAFFKLVCLYPLFFLHRGKKWVSAIGGVAVVGILLATSKQGLDSLYVDLTLAYMLGACLWHYISNKELSKKVLLFCLPLAALPLMKAIGLYLAIVIAVIISVVELSKRLSLKTLCLVSLLFVAPAAGKFSWVNFLEYKNIPRHHLEHGNSLSGSSKLYNALFGNSEKQELIRTTYFKKISKKILADVLIWLFLYLYLVRKKQIGLQRKLVIGLALGLMIPYLVGLLLLYNYTLSDFEGRNLASLTRYFQIYSKGLAYLFIALGAKEMLKADFFQKTRVNFVAKLSTLALLFCIPLTLLSLKMGSKLHPVRQRVLPAANYLREHVTSGKVVQFLNMNTQGFERLILEYDAGGEFKLVDFPWSFVPPDTVSDSWTSQVSLKEWSSFLAREQVDLLVILSSQGLDQKYYGELFATDQRISDDSIWSYDSTKEKFTLIHKINR